MAMARTTDRWIAEYGTRTVNTATVSLTQWPTYVPELVASNFESWSLRDWVGCVFVGGARRHALNRVKHIIDNNRLLSGEFATGKRQARCWGRLIDELGYTVPVDEEWSD